MQVFLQEQKDCKILLITEHWKTYEQLQLLPIDGFVLAGYWCRNHGEHGGAAVYVRRNTKYKHIKKLSDYSVKGEMECAVVECTISKMAHLIVSVYRPCNGEKDKFLELLEKLLSAMYTENRIIILGGDFNIELRKENKFKSELVSLLKPFH